jgi:hypothetical protein
MSVSLAGGGQQDVSRLLPAVQHLGVIFCALTLGDNAVLRE